MKISDLNHLEIISEAPRVVGGFSYKYGFSGWLRQIQSWLKTPIKQPVVSENVQGSAYAATNTYNNGSGREIIVATSGAWLKSNHY